ncbi:hypothetical protein QE152_g31358 [Popillia japonica]|uniref:Uncharacterized protein n=1 Tax=Popillia japonica TaxID=7064 RepID=A0AAW1J206_POPJA
MAFITQGKHISTAEKFLKDNYNLTETEFTCVKSNIQKTLLPNFKAKWAAGSRKKDRFIVNNLDWLNKDYVFDFDNTDGSTPEISTPSGRQRGKPCKGYEESSESTKKRKATKMIRHSGVDQITFSYLQALRSIGEITHAKIIEKVKYLSPELQNGLLNWLDHEGQDVLSLSQDKALAMYTELNKQEQISVIKDSCR